MTHSAPAPRYATLSALRSHAALDDEWRAEFLRQIRDLKERIAKLEMQTGGGRVIKSVEINVERDLKASADGCTVFLKIKDSKNDQEN